MQKYIFTFILGLASVLNAYSRIQLPAFFSDHMVLQRDKAVIIYGYARHEKSLKINFAGEEKTTEPDATGFFEAEFGPRSMSLQPVKLIVKGSHTIEINDILMGDVFILGGQSNMEWPLSQINNAQQEVADSDYPSIRLFTVPKTIKSERTFQMEGEGWKIADKTTVSDFSAIGFLMARQLHKEKNIPIGLIDNSWGGSNIMGWMPEEAFANMSDFEEMIKNFKLQHRNDMDLEEVRQKWMQSLEVNDQGISKGWADPDVPKSDWAVIKVPGLWEDQGYAGKDGIYWYSLDFTIPAFKESECIFTLGQIDDSDITYLNGITIGSTSNAYNVVRKYSVERDLIKTGANQLVIRVTDTGGGGGIHGVADSVYCQCGGVKTALAGNWKFVEGTSGKMEIPKTFDFNANPTNRYNEMVHPLTGLGVKAYLYYQGESDTYQAARYAELLKRMILTYRSNFGDQQMPFVNIQLANYMKEEEAPVESNWAELRRSQSMATSLPYSGMVCTIDVGDAKDIHPRDKQTVAKRALSVVKRLAYDEKIIIDGPKPDKVVHNSLGILISFSNAGESGMNVKGDEKNINGFTVKTAEGKWVRVKASKQSKTSVLLDYTDPATHIRYLWANNPGTVQIYNTEGFPAEPFEYKL